MLVWWSNIDVVDKFHTWMQILIVVFLILAAAATYLTKIATDRVSELKALEESKLIKRLGTAENDAQELRKELENTKKVSFTLLFLDFSSFLSFPNLKLPSFSRFNLHPGG